MSIQAMMGIIASSSGGDITITIDHTKVASNLTDFPIYVKPTDLGAVTLADAQSIRVFKSDGVTELPREIVSKDEMHIKTDLSSSTDTVLKVVMDGVSPDYRVTTTYGRNNVWGNYTRVGHGDQAATHDATGNAANGTAFNSPPVVSGKVGKALSFNGTNQYVRVPYTKNNTVIPRTLSAWVQIKGESGGNYGGAVGVNGSPGDNNFQTIIVATNSGSFSGRMFLNGVESGNAVNEGVDRLDEWVHVTLALNYNNTTNEANHDFYINGIHVGASLTRTTNVFQFASSGLNIGVEKIIFTRFFKGYVDEYRLSDNVTLSADWIATEYNNQNSPSTFYTITL